MNTLDFSINLPADDRKDLLQQAINEIDNLATHLGSGSKQLQSKKTDILTKIMDDAVMLPDLPMMYKITDQGFLNKGFQLPVDIQQILAKNNFYWLQIPVGVFTKENWAYSRIEVGVIMETLPNEDIPRAFRILPDKEFQQLFEFSTEGKVGLDSNFDFSVKTAEYDLNYGGNEVKAKADVTAEGGLKSKLVFGPLSYKFRKTIVDNSGKNTHMIRWVLNDTQMIQDGFDLVGIIQVPKSYKKLTISAEVRARKKLSDFGDVSGFFDMLTQKIKDFFKSGCPTRDLRTWNLAQFL